MDKKTGLVAFFDILGYQNFLEKNEPGIAAEKIVEFLKKLKVFQSETYLSFFDDQEARSMAKPLVEQIVHIVISDAILLTLETNQINKEHYRVCQILFLMYCARLFKELFIYGLPVRGAIEYGEYVLVENQMFAGRPIVRAYQSTMNLNLAACQVSKSVGNLIEDLENSVYLSCNTPLKTGEEEELILLMPFSFEDNKKDEFILSKITDLGQFVMESFCAHKKMVNKEVQKKIKNTEFFLRYCKARWNETAEETLKKEFEKWKRGKKR